MANDGRGERGAAIDPAGVALTRLAAGAAAQDAARPNAERAVVPVEVRIVATVHEGSPDEPPAAGVDARSDDLPGATLVPRPFVRGACEGWPGLPAFATEASGARSSAERGRRFRFGPMGIAE